MPLILVVTALMLVAYALDPAASVFDPSALYNIIKGRSTLV